MKNNNKLILFIVILIMSVEVTQAQVILTKDDFPRQANFSDTFYLSSQVVGLPAEGPGQNWDYSNLVADEFNVNVYSEPGNDPAFMTALNKRQRDLLFLQFFLPSTGFEALDDMGWYDMGKRSSTVSYSIQPISGSPDDSLVFVGGADVFGGRIDKVKFPTAYQDHWVESHVETTNFQLTVTAYGLNKTPGYQKRILTEDREVVGYGKLTIPLENGDSSSPMDVLLVKDYRSAIDSFFLGGAPAPSFLLGAFGISQGMMSADSFYVFYTPGYGSPVYSLDIEGVYGTNPVYRPAAAKNTTSVQDLPLVELSGFPNPVSAGQTFTLQLAGDRLTGQVELCDVLGRAFFKKTLTDGTESVSLELPATTPSGTYIIRVKDDSGNIRASQLVQIQGSN